MTAGLIVGGVRVPVAGVSVVTWQDDPKRAPKVTDGRARTAAPTAIVLHTSRGVRGTVRPGSLASQRAEVLALYQARTAREVSWHLTVDSDGTVLQQADVGSWSCWHAPPTNAWSIGVELVQQPDHGDLYEVQVGAAVKVVDALCSVLQIPRRVPVTAQGAPLSTVVPSWRSVAAGGRAEHWSGVLGHRNVTADRGPGDPGDGVFSALLAAGFAGAVVT